MTTFVDRERNGHHLPVLQPEFDTGDPGRWARASSETWQQRQPAVSKAATAGLQPGAQGRGCPLCPGPIVRPHLGIMADLVPFNAGWTPLTWSNDTLMTLRAGALTHE